MLTCLVPVLFTFYIQGVLKLKNNSGAKRLRKKLGRTCSKHGETRNGNLLFVGNPKEGRSLRKRDPSGHSYNWRIILKHVLKRQDGRA